jgi:hypothetical protein
LPQVHGELVAAVDLGGARGDFGLGKIAHGVAQRVNVFTQLEVESGQVVHATVDAVAPCRTAALWLQQPHIFIKAYRPRGQVKLARQIADAVSDCHIFVRQR